MSALMLVENTDDAPAQTERLFQPPRLKHFCPAEHCSVRCGPKTCTCHPCTDRCPFCAARKGQKFAVEFDRQPEFKDRQLHLFGGRLDTSIHQRSKK